MSDESININPADNVNILLASDCHLGYEDSKKKYANHVDSFTTFEEILQLTETHDIDFILLGGDLFDAAKPTPTTTKKCVDLLRKYCMGPKNIEMEMLSKPEVIFDHCFFKTVNWQDPGFRVKVPVFSINGNHDDPSYSSTGSLDLLSSTGLVNYIGKYTSLTNMKVAPLILRKGETHIALYGLGYVNDQRLSRLFRDGKVQFEQPEGPDTFNILALHQNRIKHGDQYSYINDNRLPEFLHFILWGHEHECRIRPEPVPDRSYFVCQPGSSVATSLCEAESRKKHVAILTVNKMKFKCKKIPLRTVRPFVFDDVFMCEQNLNVPAFTERKKAIENFIDDYIENTIIPKACTKLTGHPQQPTKPYIRLRVHIKREDEKFDQLRLSMKYDKQIANSDSMIKIRLMKEKEDLETIKKSLRENNEDFEFLNLKDSDDQWNLCLQDEVARYYENDDNKQKLKFLPLKKLNEALKQFVDYQNNDTFKLLIDEQLNDTYKQLETTESMKPEDIMEEIIELTNKSNSAIEEISDLSFSNNFPLVDFGEKSSKKKGATSTLSNIRSSGSLRSANYSLSKNMEKEQRTVNLNDIDFIELSDVETEKSNSGSKSNTVEEACSRSTGRKVRSTKGSADLLSDDRIPNTRKKLQKRIIDSDEEDNELNLTEKIPSRGRGQRGSVRGGRGTRGIKTLRGSKVNTLKQSQIKSFFTSQSDQRSVHSKKVVENISDSESEDEFSRPIFHSTQNQKDTLTLNKRDQRICTDSFQNNSKTTTKKIFLDISSDDSDENETTCRTIHNQSSVVNVNSLTNKLSKQKSVKESQASMSKDSPAIFSDDDDFMINTALDHNKSKKISLFKKSTAKNKDDLIIIEDSD